MTASPPEMARAATVEPERPGGLAVVGFALKELHQRLDGEAAGHLAALVAAHAIGDGEQAQPRLGAEVVLVVGAPPDVGQRRVLDVEGHAADTKRAACRPPKPRSG